MFYTTSIYSAIINDFNPRNKIYSNKIKREIL